ncbi:MAG: hypothetical protein PHY56_00165 [Candidatus Omnitrophica bacterium]|nr:hypothetical protein [Candidatus Omnitrophota bacterium]
MGWGDKPTEKPLPPKKQPQPPAVQQENALDVPDYVKPMTSEPAIDNEDIVVPRLKLIQEKSDEINNDMGYKAGDIINPASGENLGPQVDFVPILFQKMAIQWKPRASGGGIADICNNIMALAPFSNNGVDMNKVNWAQEMEVSNDKNNKDKNYWAKVYNFLIITESNPSPVILSMSRTKIKAAKKLLGFWQNFKDKKTMRPYPLYTFTYRLETFEDNKSGFAFWNYDINRLALTPKEIYASMDIYAQGVKGKDIKVDEDIEHEE